MTRPGFRPRMRRMLDAALSPATPAARVGLHHIPLHPYQEKDARAVLQTAGRHDRGGTPR